MTAPLEKQMVQLALKVLALEPSVVVLDFAGCRGQKQVTAKLEAYRQRIAGLEVCLVVMQTEVEARFTRAGAYAAGGCPGQADLTVLCKPTGRIAYWEAKRNDGKSKQSPKQVAFQGIATDCGAAYGVFRTPQDLVSFARNRLTVERLYVHRQRAAFGGEVTRDLNDGGMFAETARDEVA